MAMTLRDPVRGDLAMEGSGRIEMGGLEPGVSCTAGRTLVTVGGVSTLRLDAMGDSGSVVAWICEMPSSFMEIVLG